MSYPDVTVAHNADKKVFPFNPLEKMFKQDLFQDLNAAQRSLIRSSIRTIRLKQGQTLFQQGMPARSFYFIVNGWITLFRLHESGATTVIHTFGAGDMFGEVAALAINSYPVTADAATDTIVYSIPAAAYRALIERDARLAIRVINSLEQRVRILISEFERCQQDSGVNRLASFLVELSRRSNSNNGHYMLPFSKQTLAGMLHIQPETLSRAFSVLRKYGVKSYRNGRVHIPDMRALNTLLRE